METHANDLHNIPGKGWKHYFFEFFMLFLAVSLGFYAENLREEIKHEEEIKNNMRTMLADLQSDVTLFDSVMGKNEFSSMMADSLLYLLEQEKNNTPAIYHAARIVTANVGYYFSNSKTFDQLRTSGLIKLIIPKSLADSIANYYVSFQWIANQTELLRLKLDQLHKGNYELFDGFVFNEMMKIKYGTFKEKHSYINWPKGHPDLLTKDYTKINAVVLNYHYFSATSKFYNQTALSQKQMAERLWKQIIEAYPKE